MKELFLLILFFAFGSVQSQIREIDTGETKKIGESANFIKSSSRTLDGITIYTVSFKDDRYSQLNEWESFYLESIDEFDFIYDKLIEYTSNGERGEKMYDVGGRFQIILNSDHLVKNWVRISIVKNGIITGISKPLKQKYIIKAFGKN